MANRLMNPDDIRSIQSAKKVAKSKKCAISHTSQDSSSETGATGQQPQLNQSTTNNLGSSISKVTLESAQSANLIYEASKKNHLQWQSAMDNLRSIYDRGINSAIFF